ncbi:hypothetical protein Taro_029500 [Colocasia esculenta]|uniref:Secreted protein n=1 Tax=Colocasia esculenta TaxID=4460 RepID=A0A843VRB5_COLES|nr:hypothetical protein [Colocasia esculenta]
MWPFYFLFLAVWYHQHLFAHSLSLSSLSPHCLPLQFSVKSGGRFAFPYLPLHFPVKMVLGVRVPRRPPSATATVLEEALLFCSQSSISYRDYPFSSPSRILVKQLNYDCLLLPAIASSRSSLSTIVFFCPPSHPRIHILVVATTATIVASFTVATDQEKTS